MLTLRTSSSELLDGGSLIQASRSRLKMKHINQQSCHNATQDYKRRSIDLQHDTIDANYLIIQVAKEATHPSGTGTFFCALGATGLRSPAKSAVTSSPTLACLSSSFCTYFSSATAEHACRRHYETIENYTNRQVFVVTAKQHTHLHRLFEVILSN